MAVREYKHKKVGATRAEQNRHDKHRAGFEKAVKQAKKEAYNASRRKSNGGSGG